MKKWMANVLYRLDPVFRKLVDQKRVGPDDRVGAGESIVCVLRDGMTGEMRMRQLQQSRRVFVQWGNPRREKR